MGGGIAECDRGENWKVSSTFTIYDELLCGTVCCVALIFISQQHDVHKEEEDE